MIAGLDNMQFTWLDRVQSNVQSLGYLLVAQSIYKKNPSNSGIWKSIGTGAYLLRATASAIGSDDRRKANLVGIKLIYLLIGSNIVCNKNQ